MKRTMAALLLISLAGCGGGSPLEEGVPKDIDMSKNYSPSVPVGPIRPGDVKKAKAGAPAAPAGKDAAPDAK